MDNASVANLDTLATAFQKRSAASATIVQMVLQRDAMLERLAKTKDNPLKLAHATTARKDTTSWALVSHHAQSVLKESFQMPQSKIRIIAHGVLYLVTTARPELAMRPPIVVLLVHIQTQLG
jgi:hypothetical protein